MSPERMVTGAADPVCGESAGVLEELAYALESGDAERAQNAYLKAREIDARVSGLKEALVAGRETARLSPPRRRSLGHLEVYAAASDQIDLIVRDVRALTRAALSVVQPGDPVPDPLPTAIRGLARMTETLAAYLETSGDPADTHRLALEAAREASVLLTEREDLARSLSANALVDQVHSTVVDILGAAPAWIGGRPCKPWRRPRETPPGRTRTGLSRGCTRTRDAETVPALKPRVGHERPFGALASLPSSRRQSRGGWTMV